VDEIFAALDEAGTPGCAVSVMRGGAIVYAKGYGAANLEYDVPMTPASVFHVASVSKQFTATAVVLLQTDGKLSLDDDVRKYVPEVPDFGKVITLRHLAHHTSGLRDQWDLLAMAGWRFQADVVTTADVLDVTSRQTALNFDPGAEYLYSNTGYTLLGIVVERVSGQSLREFAREGIFEPLGMRSTHFHDDHQMVVKDRAYAYARGAGNVWRQSIPDFDTVGATSLFTTVADLAQWDRNFYTRQVGGAALAGLQDTRGVLSSGQSIDYALGLMHGAHQGLRTVSHGGSDAGYRAQFLRIPDRSLSVAVLCGFPTSNPGALATRVADLYLFDGRPPADETGQIGRPSGLSADDLRRLDGVYIDPTTDVPVRVSVRDGRLSLARGGAETMRPDGERRFRSAAGSVALEVMAGNGPARLRLTEASGHTAMLTSAPLWPGDGASLEAYVGVYHSDELGTEYRVVLGADGLELRHRKLAPQPMQPAFADGFRARARSMTFERDARGRVVGFTLSSARVRKVRFVRVGSGPNAG
jgi:CubicO group peptidase (beta-lactamase class C family)